jgi:signal transduction histidine kinase
MSSPVDHLESAISSNGSAPHLLIADHQSSDATALAQYMHRQGFKTTILGSADAVLRYLADDLADMIILDHNLPDRDGLSLCHDIKANPALGYIPVVVLMENPERRERLAAQISGADDYLLKPVAGQDLLLRVLALLRTKRHIDTLIAQNNELTANLTEHNRTIQSMLDEQMELRRRSNQVEILKQHIINNVNHELRTPMLHVKSAVSMLVEIMQEVQASQPDEKTQRLSRYATQAVGRMEELIYNISQLQLIEQMKLDPLSLHDAVLHGIHHVRRSWSHQGELDRVVYHSPAKKLYVIGDRRALPRIIFLLVENGLKFSPDKDSPVTIETYQSSPQQVTLTIRDHGIGIAPEFQDQIFETFYQVEQETTRRFGGVGVGLSSAQMLAHEMGTHIWVESTPGEGSIFGLELEIADIDIQTPTTNTDEF